MFDKVKSIKLIYITLISSVICILATSYSILSYFDQHERMERFISDYTYCIEAGHAHDFCLAFADD